jgi:peptidoglycan/LPS O-acetylase OafA/YrhL
MQQGRTAVSFFFVLSGFLITYLLTKEKHETSTIDLKAFYVKRIFRILPLYALICVVGFALIPLITGVSPNESIIQHIFLIANFNQIDLVTTNIQNSMVLAPLWSIAVEEQFYLIWPLLLYFIKPKYYLSLYILVFLSSYIFIYFHRNSYEMMLLHSISTIPEFMLGATLSYVVFKKHFLIEWVKNIPRWTIVSFYILSFLTIALLQPPYSYILYPFIFTLIIVEQVFCVNSLFKVSQLPWLDYFGKISYGSYMYHSIVLLLMKFIFDHFHLFSDDSNYFIKTVYFVACIALTIGISHVSFHTFEKYFLSLRKRILSK